MNKRAFANRLKSRLRGLPMREVEERISFYLEIIDDRIEDGVSVEVAIAALGDIDVIAEQIRDEIKTKNFTVKPERREWRAWEIVLVVLGSPLWITLLATAFCLVLAVFIVVWSVNLVLWAVELPLFILSYISKYLFIACKFLSRETARLSLWSIEQIKRLFTAK